MSKYESIERVAFFMNMVISGAKLDSESIKEELKDTDIIFNYMGNGASDSLTIKNVKDFLEAVGRLTMNSDSGIAKMLLLFKHDKYNYKLRIMDNDKNQIELITYPGQIHEDGTEKIKDRIRDKEKILKFLAIEKAPEYQILAVEKVFEQYDL